MAIPREALLVILQTAADEPLGLILRTSDTARARALLYKIRAESGDPRLASLQLRASPFPEGDLVICHPPTATRQPPAPADIGSTLDLELGDILE